MKPWRQFLAAFAGASMLAPAAAELPLRVDEPWVRATVPAQGATGAFMRLSAQSDLRLMAAASEAAARVEIHRMAMVGQVMQMRAIDSLPLPAGKTVVLAPGGLHIMLLGLKHQARAGDVIPLTLHLEDAKGRRFTHKVEAMVRPLGAAMAHD